MMDRLEEKGERLNDAARRLLAPALIRGLQQENALLKVRIEELERKDLIVRMAQFKDYIKQLADTVRIYLKIG